ncbi:thiamine diphosphokinase [Longirhabdus pacifica]|uniref:thiamine diphosphokinase n=1 Tax=Longirhabdus pacifica TaxID=2305227 RepID=UPI001008DCB3|nr:thiamine diphosphokinase [Longirhabdus pacifica]
MNNKVIIFSGGLLSEHALSHINEGDFVIGADRGAKFLVDHGITLDLAIGDFDSVEENDKQRIQKSSKKFISCDPVLKDYTDTEMAMNHAIETETQEIMLTGVTGTRLDHVFASVHLLKIALDKQIVCSIIDDHNHIRLVNRHQKTILKKNDNYPYVSLLPLSMEVTGITLVGFQYPLHDASLYIGQSLGISNKLVDSKGEIVVESGELLVMQTKD